MKHLFLPSLLALACAASPLRAQIEDDRENDTPTGTIWYSGINEAQINTLIGQNWRITDLQIESTSPYTFTVAMVPNSGSYGIATWWYYNVDGATVGTRLTQNNARLIDLEVVDNGAGSPRFACVMVSNTGANGKAWGWLYNATSTAVNNLVAQGNRLVDLERYTLNGNTYFACVAIANTGNDARAFWYYYGISQGSLDALLVQNNARCYDLDVVPGGYDVVMIGQGTAKNWRYYGITAQQVTDFLSQIGARLIDIERYSTPAGWRYNAVMINNSNALSTQISEILRGTTDGHSGVYLKRANGPVLAYINGDRVHEPASTLKTLHHVHAMRAVQLGQTTLQTNYTTFTAGGGNACPGGVSSPVVESLEAVLSQMLGASDNNRTRTITDNFGGFAALNARAADLGMPSTQVNHHIGCGTPPNETTLRDIAHLHERVINGYLGAERETFYELMRNDYQGSGYAEGALWPILQAESMGAGLNAAQFDAFQNGFYMAFKKGGYGTGAGYFRCWGGYVRIPFYTNGGVDLREYMVGSFVAEASNEANAIDAAKNAAAEVLRYEVRAAMQSFQGYVPGYFVNFGYACAGSSSTPSHTATGTPELGQAVTYRLSSAPVFAPAVLYFGTSHATWNGVALPFSLAPLQAPGCYIRTNSLIAVPMTVGILGGSAVVMAVPIDPQLIGHALYSQCLVVDPGANQLGITSTQGVTTHIGGRP